MVITVVPPPESRAPVRPPRIEYETEDQIVAEGNTTQFGVRLMGNAPAQRQWERSRDGGKTWAPIPGAHGITLAVTPTSRPEYDGNLFRCVVRNAAPGQSVTRPMKLTVRPAGTGPLNHSRWMIDCSSRADPRPMPGLPDCKLVLGVPSLGPGPLQPAEVKP